MFILFDVTNHPLETQNKCCMKYLAMCCQVDQGDLMGAVRQVALAWMADGLGILVFIFELTLEFWPLRLKFGLQISGFWILG